MYEGVNTLSKQIDVQEEFERYLNTIEVTTTRESSELNKILYQLFLGAFRIIFDYRWLPQCEGCDLTGIKVEVSLKENEEGNRENAILGKWLMRLNCENGVTKKATLSQIEKDMERFIRKRYEVEEPQDLTVIAKDYERKKMLELFRGSC